jgi:hypothetical protein
MPLVLVHNDVVANPQHEWDDKEGVQYHYPAKYQSKIKTDEPFVYYRGVHRVGGKRGAAEAALQSMSVLAELGISGRTQMRTGNRAEHFTAGLKIISPSQSRSPLRQMA